MLNLSKTMQHKTVEMTIAAGHSVPEEGMPLVRELVNGKEVVRVFDGVGTPLGFIGFSYAETLTPRTVSAVEEITLVGGKGDLLHTPITGQIGAVNLATGLPVAGADLSFSGKEVTISTAGLATATVRVTYRYVPTVEDLLFEHRMLVPMVQASDIAGSIGVIQDGEVYTDQFNAASNFADPAAKLYCSPAGTITTTAAGGIEIKNAQVIAIPSVSNPFLGLRITL